MTTQTVSATLSKTGTSPDHSGFEKVTISWSTNSDTGVASDLVNLVGEVKTVITVPTTVSDNYSIKLMDTTQASVDYLNSRLLKTCDETSRPVLASLSSVTRGLTVLTPVAAAFLWATSRPAGYIQSCQANPRSSVLEMWSSIQNIPPGTPPENICAMFNTALEYGRY
jgi:hypothetical protein